MTTAETLVAPSVPPLAGEKQSLMKAVLFMMLASLAMLPHFILNALFGPIGFVGIVAVSIGGMLFNAEFAFAVLLICLFLQNLFIAIVTPITPGIDQFTPMLGTSFVNIVITAMFCGVIWLKARRDLPPENNMLLRSLIVFFIVILVYTGIGAARASLPDALIYTRVYLVGGFMLIIGVALGLRMAPGYAGNVMRALTFLLVLWGIMEFCLTYELYSLFHVADYMRLKYATDIKSSFYSIQETINFASRSYLNLSGSLGLDVDILRPMGPNMHPISYAYALAFGAIVSYIYRAPLLMIGCLALLVLVGAKGPLIMGFLSLALGTFYRYTSNRGWLLVLLVTSMVLYTAIGLVYGSYTEDYHVVGFWGGVHGFFSNPIGYGVGIGGNLSTLATQMTNFSLFQGYGASFALESGFGVMIYQIGVCTVFFLIFYVTLWKNVWRATLHFPSEPNLVAIPCALAILLVNSIFQEEAFSPAGWGPLMLLSGLLLARYWRSAPHVAATAG